MDCQRCSKVFSRRDALTRHVRSVHAKETDTEYYPHSVAHVDPYEADNRQHNVTAELGTVIDQENNSSSSQESDQEEAETTTDANKTEEETETIPMEQESDEESADTEPATSENEESGGESSNETDVDSETESSDCDSDPAIDGIPASSEELADCVDCNNPRKRRFLVTCLGKENIDIIFELIEAILSGRLPMNERDRKKLVKHKDSLRRLRKCKQKSRKQNLIEDGGGFLKDLFAAATRH